MRVCCVKHCKNTSVKKYSAVKVHVVPKDKIIAEQWLKAVAELRETKKQRPALCQKHFRPEDYAGKKKLHLKPKAVPSVNLAPPNQDSSQCHNSRHSRLMKRISQVQKANASLRVECRKRRTALAKEKRGKLQVTQRLLESCDGIKLVRSDI